MYTEMIFPQKGVRFIAINDGVDSAQGDNDFAPLRNIFNEWLVRDTSKKIKAVKRSKGMSGNYSIAQNQCPYQLQYCIFERFGNFLYCKFRGR